MTSEIRKTLNERGGRYGRFDHRAQLADMLIDTAQFNFMDKRGHLEREGWKRLQPDQRHAIRYILDKIARILEGDPDYTDNWHDIAGYATLIEDRLNGTGLYAPTVEANSEAGFEYTYSDENGDRRCKSCGAEVGHAHSPDCIIPQAIANPGRSTGR